MKKKLVLLFSVILLSGCEIWDIFSHVPFGARNNSNHEIVVYFNLKEIKSGKYTGQIGWPNSLEEHMRLVVPAKSDNVLSFAGKNIKRYDSITILAFSPDTLAKYSYEEIKRTNNCLEEYTISSERPAFIEYPINY